jgi:hypothetical protein
MPKLPPMPQSTYIPQEMLACPDHPSHRRRQIAVLPASRFAQRRHGRGHLAAIERIRNYFSEIFHSLASIIA